MVYFRKLCLRCQVSQKAESGRGRIEDEACGQGRADSKIRGDLLAEAVTVVGSGTQVAVTTLYFTKCVSSFVSETVG